MSPILVRPVREQLEHDRLIRHLLQKYKRKFEVALNLGEEQAAPVKFGALTLFPDLVLTSARKLAGVVEVESAESVNNLEALAQWVHFGKARVPFHLYVPVTAYETARRLIEANGAKISEVWTYRPATDGFDLVRMSSDPTAVAMRPSKPVAPRSPAPKPQAVKSARPPAKAPARPAPGPQKTSASRSPKSGSAGGRKSGPPGRKAANRKKAGRAAVGRR